MTDKIPPGVSGSARVYGNAYVSGNAYKETKAQEITPKPVACILFYDEEHASEPEILRVFTNLVEAEKFLEDRRRHRSACIPYEKTSPYILLRSTLEEG